MKHWWTAECSLPLKTPLYIQAILWGQFQPNNKLLAFLSQLIQFAKPFTGQQQLSGPGTDCTRLPDVIFHACL